MSQPGEGIGAALDAMRSDASAWERAADDLDGPINATAPLTVTPAHVSMWAADKGIDKTMNEARDALEYMLRKGQSYFRTIGGNLRSAADQYQRDDEQGMHGLNETQGGNS